jgi:DNA gyrase/topoisomerase IV subunit A
MALQSAPLPLSADVVVPEHQELTQLTDQPNDLIEEEKKSLACIREKMKSMYHLYAICAQTSSNYTPRHKCDTKAYTRDAQYIVDEAGKVVSLACTLHPEDAKGLHHKEDTFKSKIKNLEHYFKKCQKNFVQCKIKKFDRYLGEALQMVTLPEAAEGKPGICTQSE